MTDNEFIDYFLKKFPQFEIVKDKIDTYYNQSLCRFPMLQSTGCAVACESAGAFTATKRGFSNSGTNLKIKVNKDAACLVVAHYLTVYEMPEDLAAGSAGNSGGIVNSASVGDVSVGMQAKPINDMFEDFMASTVYGRDFLAWLASVGGITLIN